MALFTTIEVVRIRKNMDKNPRPLPRVVELNTLTSYINYNVKGAVLGIIKIKGGALMIL